MDDILQYQRKETEDFYHILSCDELSTVEQIIAEYKIKALECHPDKHPDDPTAGERFAKLQRAKEVLTDPESRENYDTWRLCGIAMSFESWCARKNSVKTSMHWGSKAKKEPMLEDRPREQTGNPDTAYRTYNSIAEDSCRTDWYKTNWQSEQGGDMLKKFRNYEI